MFSVTPDARHLVYGGAWDFSLRVYSLGKRETQGLESGPSRTGANYKARQYFVPAVTLYFLNNISIEVRASY
jgi:hypothetical protein